MCIYEMATTTINSCAPFSPDPDKESKLFSSNAWHPASVFCARMGSKNLQGDHQKDRPVLTLIYFTMQQ